MAEATENKGNEAQTAQDVLKMSGNDELKFGVLIGLIKVGQVTNKEVVDTVLNLVRMLGQWMMLKALIVITLGASWPNWVIAKFDR